MIFLDERPHLQAEVLQNPLPILLFCLILPLEYLPDVLFIDSGVLMQVDPQFLCLLMKPGEFELIGVQVIGKRGIL